MPRQPKDIETETRQVLDKAIEQEALQTDELTFYPPSYVVSLLEDWGYDVTKATVINYYHKHGIRNERGLWVRKVA